MNLEDPKIVNLEEHLASAAKELYRSGLSPDQIKRYIDLALDEELERIDQ